MKVCGYSLDMYCDNENQHIGGYYNDSVKFPLNYTADGRGCEKIAVKKAKQDGWKFTRSGKHYCPICKNKINQTTPQGGGNK